VLNLQKNILLKRFHKSHATVFSIITNA